ncbi:hypothetical protein A2Z33_02140 [Candidatus Gottesmanbacteria bacterium RBG_16_52_11]|uniref:Uncharacterized protein n=1 Tax=Candidatus Gottesmanbacteria bacterium RBG_16_52_11 TaxID=1798374 RepID=A0A1F5YQU7_9BACT|nr:MAG: hypothetical protein A2Z33_02140 [Candidatus Gottesmanbacteria bacterium RBG_16_52_11]
MAGLEDFTRLSIEFAREKIPELPWENGLSGLESLVTGRKTPDQDLNAASDLLSAMLQPDSAFTLLVATDYEGQNIRCVPIFPETHDGVRHVTVWGETPVDSTAYESPAVATAIMIRSFIANRGFVETPEAYRDVMVLQPSTGTETGSAQLTIGALNRAYIHGRYPGYQAWIEILTQP